jgi:hypothetical protein
MAMLVLLFREAAMLCYFFLWIKRKGFLLPGFEPGFPV